MTTNYAVKFDWTGEGLLNNEEAMKQAIEGLYPVYYNEYANEANKHIPDWNREADALGIKPSEDRDNDYEKFMWQKHYEMLTNMMTSNPLFMLIASKSDALMNWEFWLGEELELHLKLTTMLIGWIDVTFHLEEVKA